MYIHSAIAYFVYLFIKKDKAAKLAYGFAIVGLITHTAALILRTVESGHAPFTNMYESLSFLAWSAILAYVVMEGKFRDPKSRSLLHADRDRAYGPGFIAVDAGRGHPLGSGPAELLALAPRICDPAGRSLLRRRFCDQHPLSDR